ncbi:MAG TPA: 4-hydroxy-tetrahydrodipicolinate reductase [Chitinophagaceae bacterium]|jgi:4-hydroxy-tetrahydrodipicolinate reductase|nr:4-hydroxy-tetrahydrodipicolinate reductase [Chitinophagaceae bacterium]
MKIALIGYGKMGKAIEEIALQRNHEIVVKIDEHNQADFTRENIANVQVAIEFTGPHSAYNNVKKLIDFNCPVVCGSTGWLDQLDTIKKYCAEKNGSFLHTTNFSIGVNIFFEINKRLAALMAPHSDYGVSITEIHHTQKKDAPSGTAISIAEQIIANLPRKTKWVNHISDNPDELEIISERVDPAPGTHKVAYSSAIDDIEIIHTAHSRKGFALGAVIAAEFICNRKGVFQMSEVLGL